MLLKVFQDILEEKGSDLKIHLHIVVRICSTNST